MNSFFHTIQQVPDDPILGLPKLFNADTRKEKVNLGIGNYKTNDGSSYLLNCVAKAEELILSKKIPIDYLPPEGDPLFLEKMIALNLGETSDKERVFAIQTIGGTGSLKLAADFFCKFLSKHVAISDPSWANHVPLFRSAGFDVTLYPYYDQKTHQISFNETLNTLRQLPKAALVLFQSACHNPTGADYTKLQWQTLMELVKQGHLIPLFDNAYQGFGTSIEEDAYPIRLFHENNIEMVIATACSKNFGLYGERVGALIFSIHEKSKKIALLSQLRQMIRSNYSSPPTFGAKIVGEILSDALIKSEWENELNAMRKRIQTMRKTFTRSLTLKSNDRRFEYLENEQGFFSLLDISPNQVLKLREKKAIHLPMNGRINMAGLTPNNIDYCVDSLLEVFH